MSRDLLIAVLLLALATICNAVAIILLAVTP